MTCPLTGRSHRLIFVHGSHICQDCKQKVIPCCEGAPQS